MNPADLKELPGSEFVLPGIADFCAGKTTIESLLVEIGQNRLRLAGIKLSPRHHLPKDDRWPEIRLYETICNSGIQDPYRHYNSLLRKLISFEQSLEHRQIQIQKSKLN